MPSRTIARLAGWTAGLGAVAVALWVSRPVAPPAASPPPGPGRAPFAATPAKASPSPPPSLAAELETALITLLRAVARGEARQDEAVLSFRDDTARQRFLAAAAAAGLTVAGELPALRTVRLHFDDPADLRRALAATGADSLELAPNRLATLPLPPPREDRSESNAVPFGRTALEFLGAGGDRSAWGRGVTIAILDTGVAAADPTFAPGAVRALDVGFGADPARGEADGHGTAIAALATGRGADAPGVAPAASLLSIRVTDATSTSDLFTLARAIVAATDAGAGVINISLGAYATAPVLDRALAYATERGALVVAAAGNDQAAQLTWPAADPRVISVGAVDRAGQQVAFSNSGAQLQLAAPGYGVATAWLDQQRVALSGTSASAPLVAGAVAAVQSLLPSLTPRQAADLLLATANDAGAPGADPAFGHGIVNLATALNRHNPAYVDTAIASQTYDATRGELVTVIQNRSGRTIGGLTLEIAAPARSAVVPVPNLAAGEIHVARTTVGTAATAGAAPGAITSTLRNPPGATDAVPPNNQRRLALPAAGPP